MNIVKEIDVKSCTNYFFDDMINIKGVDSNKVKIDKKSYKNIFIFYVGYMRIKDLIYVKIYIVNPLYLIVNNINGCNEGSDGNKYLTLVSTYESKNTLKEYEKLWNKIRDLITSMTHKQLGQL